MKRLLLLFPMLAMGCSIQGPEAGRVLYQENCATCHGAKGRGDGPSAANLRTPPADLTKISARRAGVWPMLEVMSIVDGYSRQTLRRDEMPIFGDFLDGDLVKFDTGNGVMTPTPAKLIAMVNYLETLQDPAPTDYVP
ncbi:c-type cytochrome [Primorskyibacter sp. 2E233]|uniref:c-type cytochrome n=1 Tax=Primorskyibacter sp. 2E233 TaxID=3413431 RepID=UPI003BF0AAC1